MLRRITGFAQDDAGDWVASLSCLHRQHVRHKPPLWPKPWVLTDAGRADKIGTELDCSYCDRAEMPDDLRLARTAGPWNDETLPDGLRRTHRVADATWGRLRVTEGTVGITIETVPPITARLDAGGAQPIPPGVPHLLTFETPFSMEVDFFVQG